MLLEMTLDFIQGQTSPVSANNLSFIHCQNWRNSWGKYLIFKAFNEAI